MSSVNSGPQFSTEDENGSSAPASQEDILHFDEEVEEPIEDKLNSLQLLEEQEECMPHSSSHSPLNSEEPVETPSDEKVLFSPDEDGYFTISSTKSMEQSSKYFKSNSRITVVGLFGREKSHDSDKAVEIFDYLAQRDIFSAMYVQDFSF